MAPDFPKIFILPTQLSSDKLHDLEDKVPTLTYDLSEARVVVGNINRRERALFELRRLKLITEPITSQADSGVDELDEKESEDRVKVLKLSWLTDCLEQDVLLPTREYLLYEGRKLASSPAEGTGAGQKRKREATSGSSIIERASGDQAGPAAKRHEETNPGTRRDPGDERAQPPALLHETTSEHDAALPPIPDFLHTTYSCQRSTLAEPPNSGFIEALKEVRTIRLLQGDQVGVRAYSTSIATLAAYPHVLHSAQEVARLPGCGAKIAQVFQQWEDAGTIHEIEQTAEDPKLLVLKRFYDIWGVGSTTALELYRKGWRDIDDLIEYGWDSLSRVQQIGVKYYEEFQDKIPRPEVESIAATILEHSHRIDKGYCSTIVGGYRRGKQASGDVDVILSHRDESKTLRLIERLVLSLETDGFITHTLSLSNKNSERGQQPLPWKGEGSQGSGFDTLDKALVVWQDPHKEDAPHRRVDIIISPWKTVGCALLGWSGGTTFQRDLRRYCKRERGLKFDSSGIRSRTDGHWVDIEDAEGDEPASDMVAAERRVFAGLGLTWRRPEERCTG